MSMFKSGDKDTTSNLPATDRARENASSATSSSTPATPVRDAFQQLPKAVQPSMPSVSVISKALKITGQLESTEDIQIDGEVDGDIHGTSVTVGQNAKVKGSVYGETVELAGKIDGKIEANKVVLTSTARMHGDVIHQNIRIDSGAFIDGHCRPGSDKVVSPNNK
jgi:cytoskeletal protein CcmA (bactofilin family)